MRVLALRLLCLVSCIAQYVLSSSYASYIYGYYTFDGNSLDSSGNSRSCTGSGGVTLTTGKNGVSNTAYQFSSGYFDCGYTDVPAANIKTMSVWVKWSSFTGEVISKSAGSAGFEILINSNKLCTFLMGNTGTDYSLCWATSNLALNTWYHVVATHNGVGGTVALYVNGALKLSGTYSQSKITDGTKLIIGNWNPLTRYFSGSIDEVLIMSTQLTATEVNNLYLNTKSTSLSYASMQYAMIFVFTNNPTVAPSFLPTIGPSLLPSIIPTLVPTVLPTVIPTMNPTVLPSLGPSVVPTVIPSLIPTVIPSIIPSLTPSLTPTISPSITPSVIPSITPSVTPSVTPSITPSIMPSVAPSLLPSVNPTLAPSAIPSLVPSMTPTVSPTFVPTVLPSMEPSTTPSIIPTIIPSRTPSTTPTIIPTANPSLWPSINPTTAPSIDPTVAPSVVPTLIPSNSPSTEPSMAPSLAPSVNPSVVPSVDPSFSPSITPTVTPSAIPTLEPTRQPTANPSINPSVIPSVIPTIGPSLSPSVIPTIAPSVVPTVIPSQAPTPTPSVAPSEVPTVVPSITPSAIPTVFPSETPTEVPHLGPSRTPTRRPTFIPTVIPSIKPTVSPTLSPTVTPSVIPTIAPSASPSRLPSIGPSVLPSVAPSEGPTVSPTVGPSVIPSITPSIFPSITPSLIPTVAPSIRPSFPPTVAPSVTPSVHPTLTPSVAPSLKPSLMPSANPSIRPTVTPTKTPTVVPTLAPSVAPSLTPSVAPSKTPSICPSVSPSIGPTLTPSEAPSIAPSLLPSIAPSVAPTKVPTEVPTVSPTIIPSVTPSVVPSLIPTVEPSVNPSTGPSVAPTPAPTIAPTSNPSISPSTSPSAPPTVIPSASPSIAPTATPSQVPTCRPTVCPSAVPSRAPYWSSRPKSLVNDSISVIGSAHNSFKIVIPFLSSFSGVNAGIALSNIVLTDGSSSTAFIVSGNRTQNSEKVLSGAVVSNYIGFDSAKRAVSILRDINDDGIDDIIIGDPYHSRCYVLFGSTQGLTNMTEGFTIFGEQASDLTGWSVNGAGDVNNDTFNDIIIGAPLAKGVGAVYVVFGRRQFLFDLYLSNLTASQGFVVYGSLKSDYLGVSVSDAGDVNKDGYDDVIVGAVETALFYAGSATIIFGSSYLPSLASISTLASTDGVKISGVGYQFLGCSVCGAGDANRDGYDDVLIGSFPTKSSLKQGAYLIYGSAALTNMDTTDIASQGVHLLGAGSIVVNVGDANGDGYSDVLVGSSASNVTTGLILYTNVSFLTLEEMTTTPSVIPSLFPSLLPSMKPLLKPTRMPSSFVPTKVPMINETEVPSFSSTMAPTIEPSVEPSEGPTAIPSGQPSEQPSVMPTTKPSSEPTNVPTEAPVESRIILPTVRPTSPPVILRLPYSVPTLPPTSQAPQSFSVVNYLVDGHSSKINDSLSKYSTRYVVNATGEVEIDSALGSCTFVIVPGFDLTLTIPRFNVSSDLIDVSMFADIRQFSDLVITAGSIIITLSDQQVVHILNHEPADISAKNFVFGTRGPDRDNKLATAILIILVFVFSVVSVVVITLIFCWLQKRARERVAVALLKRALIGKYDTDKNGQYVFHGDDSDNESKRSGDSEYTVDSHAEMIEEDELLSEHTINSNGEWRVKDERLGSASTHSAEIAFNTWEQHDQAEFHLLFPDVETGALLYPYQDHSPEYDHPYHSDSYLDHSMFHGDLFPSAYIEHELEGELNNNHQGGWWATEEFNANTGWEYHEGEYRENDDEDEH